MSPQSPCIVHDARPESFFDIGAMLSQAFSPKKQPIVQLSLIVAAQPLHLP
jgi:hypothetical protein